MNKQFTVSELRKLLDEYGEQIKGFEDFKIYSHDELIDKNDISVTIRSLNDESDSFLDIGIVER